VFQLTFAEAMLVQGSFFLAYFIGSLIYFIISSNFGDPINKIGYKNGLIVGLLVAALGLFLFYPSAVFKSYGFFLSALFVLGLGFTILQIAANPYVAILGPPESASGRLNLAQGFNSFGTTIAPVIGGYLIFDLFGNGKTQGADAVKVPYLFFAGFVVLVAILIWFAKLPKLTHGEQADKGFGAFKYPQLSLGIIAIFMYVGGEVAIGSILTSYLGLPEIAGLKPSDATIFVSLYWGGLMIGRFTGSASMSDMSFSKKVGLSVLIPALVFPVLMLIFYLKGTNLDTLQEFTAYIIFLALLVVGFAVGKFQAARTLMVFSIINACLIAIAIATTGSTSMWTLVAVGLFNSIMWSNIFTLAIHGLGKDTSQGSSLLVMAILGGAIIPPLQGLLADNKHIGVHHSIVLPIICFVYLAFYGWKTRNLIQSGSTVQVAKAGH
jgi:FHS family L-fucose permease-like MFS transporter